MFLRELKKALQEIVGKKYEVKVTSVDFHNESVDEVNILTRSEHEWQVKIKRTNLKKNDYSFELVQFALSQYPACCGVLIMHHMTWELEKNIKSRYLKIMQAITKFSMRMGYTYLQCITSVEMGNNRESIAAMKKVGFTLRRRVKNFRTGNTLSFWECKLFTSQSKYNKYQELVEDMEFEDDYYGN